MLLRQAYFELLFQQSRIATQREFAGYAAQSLGAAESRLKIGDISPSEANRFRLDAARAQNDLRQAEVDARRARFEVAKTIGAEADAEKIAAELTPLTTLLPGQAVSTLGAGLSAADANADQRTDLLAAANRVSAAEAARALAKSIATRDVTLSAQFDRWPASSANPQGTGNSFSVYFSIPLSVRHGNEGEAKRAASDLLSARDTLLRLRVQAVAESQLFYDAWRAGFDRATRVERGILPLAREVATAAEFAYKKGATTVLDLLDARRTLKQVELDAAQAQADAGKAWAMWAGSVENANKNPDINANQ